MAQTVNLRLSRADNSPWGFRLQGGKDFGQPLLIQKVNGGSIAERAGLQVGDAVIRVNNAEVAEMRHKEAQDTIVKAGNNIEITVQRGGSSVWKPHVSPVGSVPVAGKASPAATVTKTSLAAGRSPAPAIGSGHNLSPKPFAAAPQVNGDPSVKAIVNKQYNTPVQMYSEETIAETLSAQAEVLAGGAIGVNFMKNEKTYDSQKSEVFKMVQEVDKEPREPEQPDSGTPVGPAFGLRHVQPPEVKPAPASPQPQQLPPGQNICADCERLIVGVFVRIKDKNLHVECFKCATCGTSLKNVGYYNINNKLYCDIHAKMVARQNPPAPNLEPVTVAPGSRAPVGAFSTPQLSAAPQSPQPGTLAPLPFHAPRTTTSHVVAPRFGRQTSAPSGPKPFGSVSVPAAPTSVAFTPSVIAPPPSAPISSVPPPPAPSSLSKPLPDSITPVVWPPTSQSQVLKSQETTETQYAEKRLSVCSEEVSSIASKRLEICSSIVEEERPASPIPDKSVRLDVVEKSLIEAGERVRQRSVSPRPPMSPRPITPSIMTPKHFRVETPDLLDVSTKPHDIHSLLPPASVVRPLTPKQVVVFPPEFPTVMYPRSPTPRREKKSPDRSAFCQSPTSAFVALRKKEEAYHTDIKKSVESSHHAAQTIKKSEHSVKETKHIKEHKEEKKSVEKSERLKSNELHEKEAKLECSSKHIEKNECVKSKELHEKEAKLECSSKKAETKFEKFHEEKIFYTKSEVEKLVQEEISKALARKELKEEKKELIEEKEQEVSVHDLPKPIAPSGWMTSALTTASERPFSPVPFPKPMELPSISEKIIPMVPIEIKKDDKPVPLPAATEPYFPPPPPPPDQEGRDERTARALREVGCRSPLTEALTVAPERPYSPLPSFTEVKTQSKPQPDSAFKPIPCPKKDMSMTSALTIAPTVPFTVPGKTPIPAESCAQVSSTEKKSAFTPVAPKPFVAAQKTEKFGVDLAKIATQGHMKETIHSIESGKISKAISQKTTEKHLLPYYQENIGEIPVRNRSISPVPHVIVAPSIKPTPPYIPQPSKPKQETHISRKEAFSQSKSKEQSEKAEYLQTKHIPPRPTTPSGLHPPGELPYYQQNIGVIPLRNKAISPVPHIIKAPQLDTQCSSMQQGYKSTVYSETKTYSAQKSSSQSLTSNITTIKETKLPERSRSPQIWKLETKRTVQNLSPITVRLQSPRPATPTIQGEKEQKAIAKVEIHRPRPSSPLPPTVKVKVEYPPGEPSTPVLSSGKSAFASVKNGTSTQIKKSEQSSGIQKQQKEGCFGGTSGCSQESEKKCNSESGCTKKSSVQSQETNQQMTQTTSSVKSESHEMREQQSVAQKTSHSGITSFRAYGETSRKTIGDDCYGVSGKHQELKLQEARVSKTFEQKHEGKMQQCAMISKVEQKKEEKSQQNTAKSSVEQKHERKLQESGATCSIEQKNKEKVQQSGAKAIEQTHAQKMQQISARSTTEQKYSGGSQNISLSGQTYSTEMKGTLEQKHSSVLKSNLPIKKPAIGDNKSSVGLSSCPLPTFPSLPQLSDVPWTPGAGGRTATFAGSSAPKRGRGILNPSVAPGARIPLCGHCNMQIRGPFITALGKIWCPDHFVCVNGKCRRPLQDIGFVEEPDGLYCEFCYEQYLAPTCDKCHSKIKGDCLNAIGKHFHPECFSCAYCGKLFGNNPFFLEDALPYCEADWNELFTTKCFSCGFPIEAGDRWVEALNNNYHSQCFNCTMCKKNLEGQSFFAKSGRPFCKNHAR